MDDDQGSVPQHSLQAPPLLPLVELTLSYPIEECFNDRVKIEKVRQEIRRWTRERAVEVEEYLLHFNTFDILSNILISQLSINPETYKETEHEGLSSIVEYACLLMAKHPFNPARRLVDGKAVENIIDRIHTILRVRILYDATEDLPAEQGQERPAIDFFSFHTKGYESTVRSPGYLHHLRERLHALFDPFAAELYQCVGFDISDVMKVEDAYEQHIENRMDERRQIALDAKQQFMRNVEQYRLGNVDAVEQEARRTTKILARMSDDQMEEQIENLVGIWILTFCGESIYAFTPDALAVISGCSVERVKAVLQFFGTVLGSVKEDTSMPSPIHILRSRPFVYSEDDYIYSVPSSMLWASRARLEDVLNFQSAVGQASTKEWWDRYEKARSSYLEGESLRLLQLMLKSALVSRNLKYKLQPTDEIPMELDGLIRFDETLILVEAKAGSLTPTARQGSKKRLENNLKSLFGNPHDQAARAKKYIEDNPSPVFTNANGKIIEIDKGSFIRILTITVTLEALDHYSSQMYDMNRAGIFGEGELPWAVSIDSLRVIAEMIEFPSQFIHYLLRRLRVNELGKLRFFDELDMFGCYLHHGLYFDDDERFEQADMVQFTSFTTEFDDFYAHEMGVRKTPASKPRQEMPDWFRKIILDIESHREASGYSEVVIALLHWSYEAREQIGNGLKSIRETTSQDRKFHNFRMSSDKAASGLTCLSSLSTQAEPAFANLVYRVREKTIEFKATQWIGLLTCIGDSQLIHGFVIDKFNERMLSKKPPQ